VWKHILWLQWGMSLLLLLIHQHRLLLWSTTSSKHGILLQVVLFVKHRLLLVKYIPAHMSLLVDWL
jgi:hypothetical protein